MRSILKWLIVVLTVAFAATLLWDQRDRIASLSNTRFLIQGEWYRVEMGFRGDDLYEITERIIDKNGLEWASYEILGNSRIELTTNTGITTYHVSFPDDDTMIWSVESEGQLVPSVRWVR
jgi:hypothetical protein